MKNLVLAIAFLLLLVACSPSEEEIAQATREASARATNQAYTQSNLDSIEDTGLTRGAPPTYAPSFLTRQAEIAELGVRCDPIDTRELETYADDHIGERVSVTGEIFSVDADVFQMWVSKSNGGDFVVIVGTENADTPRLYEDDTVTVCGIVLGELEGTNAFGASISNPAIMAIEVDK